MLVLIHRNGGATFLHPKNNSIHCILLNEVDVPFGKVLDTHNRSYFFRLVLLSL
jgi:hypothetical protein